MPRPIVLAIALSLLPVVAFAVDSEKAKYMGGTATSVKEKAEGPMVTNLDTGLRFDAKKDGLWEVPYTSITELEYGQKAGRRVAMGIMLSPLALFSKQRSHYLTITYTDPMGLEQAVVFELGKNIVRTTLKIIEVRSGKQVQFQDEEARKSLGGGK